MEKEGPSIIEVRSYSQTQRVCGDCKYHRKERWMCGHKSVTDNFYCMHPDVTVKFLDHEGRTIAFDSEETPSTPEWCPFLKANH